MTNRNLLDLAHDHDDFYVPSFRVKVGGQDLMRDLYLAVTKVQVDLKLRMAGHFSFTIAGAFDWTTREFVANRGQERIDLLEMFAFGSPVVIELGYGSVAELKPVLSGLITEIGTGFSEGGTPELTISGYDDLYRLGVGQLTRGWKDQPDSAAVEEVVRAEMAIGEVVATEPKRPRIDKSGETDLAFVERLAKANGFIFYMRAGKFYFGPRQNKRSAVMELAWGEGLSSFSPSLNLAKQITAVEVCGQPATDGEAVIGRAQRGEESGRESGGESGGDLITAAISKSPVMRVRAAVHSVAEAEAHAKAILEERAQDFLTADGECIGLPDIVPDTNIALTGLGRAFSRTFYVSEATHTLDSGGYRTSFKVQETTA